MGLIRAGSAPAIDARVQGSRPAKSGPADTPYVRRKVVDQRDVYMRERQKKMNQLPPVHPSAQPVSASLAQPSSQERCFERSLESLQAGRQQMERQGFNMRRLNDTALSEAAETDQPVLEAQA